MRKTPAPEKRRRQSRRSQQLGSREAHEPHATLAEVAAELGISITSAIRIEKQALVRLRRVLTLRGVAF